MPRSSYYDIDAILAEEELVPCTTLFDFNFLSHLDADCHESGVVLPEGKRIKIPLWAVSKWAMLGFVRLSLPRHYNKSARERLEAEPGEVDLRKKNERFFLSGRMLVALIETSSTKVAKAIAAQGANRRVNAHRAALESVLNEARELRKTLLMAYTGDRLRQTLDWSLSSVGDDVTAYTSKLTEMERRLFQCGANAASMHEQWKLYGNRRFVLPKDKNINEATSGDEQGDSKRARVN